MVVECLKLFVKKSRDGDYKNSNLKREKGPADLVRR